MPVRPRDKDNEYTVELGAAPTNHDHVEADITDLDHYNSSDFATDHNAVSGDHVTGGDAHTHTESDITDLDHYTSTDFDTDFAASDLADAGSGAAADGTVATADGAGGVAWEAGGGGASALDDLTDVNAATPAEGDTIRWDDTASEWVNAQPGYLLTSGFPTVLSVTEDSGAAATSHSVDMPATVAENDLLIMYFGAYWTEAWEPTGDWTELTTTDNGSRLYIFARKADGTEGGTTETMTNITNGTGRPFASQVYRISAASWSQDINDIGVATPVEASSAAPDPPEVTAGASAADYLFIASCACNNANTVITAGTIDYTDLNSHFSPGSASAVAFATAVKELNATSDDPGTFSLSTGRAHGAHTISIAPATAFNGIDHGELVGIGDDDHTQYLNDTRHANSHPSLRAERITSDQSIPNNSVTTAIFNSILHEDDADGDFSYDTGTGVLTINTAGVYAFATSVAFPSNTGGNRRLLRIDISGHGIIGGQTVNPHSGTVNLNVATIFKCSATQTVNVTVFQDSGGALNMLAASNTFFSVNRIA